MVLEVRARPGVGSRSCSAQVQVALAVSVRGVRLTDLELGDAVAVLGAGPIGLLAGLVARRLGPGRSS